MSRDLFLLGSEFREVVDEVLSRCYELGVEMRPYFTLRTPWEQARLWRQSRPIEEIMEAIRKLERNGAPFLAHVLRTVGPQNGPHVTDALPGLSWHQWAEAVDCYWHLDGQAEWSTRKKIELADGREMNGYRLYGEIGKELELTSGGFWSQLVDWPHLQQRPNSVVTYYAWPEIDREMRKRHGETEAGSEPEFAVDFGFETGSAEDDGFVKVKEDKFYVGGKEFKFVGVNIRGLVHYGKHYSHGPGMPWPIHNPDPDVQANPQQAQLQLAYGFGARVIRVFLAHRNAETQEIIDGLDNLLELITRMGLKDLYLLPALTNYYESVPFHVRGDKGEVKPEDKFYSNGTLGLEWYRGGYQRYYQPFVEKVVGEFQDHPNILAWEVGNELAIRNVDGLSNREKAQLVTKFMNRMGRMIKQIDPNHLVTTGMTGTAKAWMWTNGNDDDLRRDLYEPFDFITIHYPRDKPNPFGRNADDVELATKLLHKPFIIEEDLVCKGGYQDHIGAIADGCEPCDRRAVCFKHHLEEWLGKEDSFGNGAGGYMIWGFDPARVSDDDPGGIGVSNPPDWGELRNLFSTYAEELARRLERFGSRL